MTRYIKGSMALWIHVVQEKVSQMLFWPLQIGKPRWGRGLWGRPLAKVTNRKW